MDELITRKEDCYWFNNSHSRCNLYKCKCKGVCELARRRDDLGVNNEAVKSPDHYAGNGKIECKEAVRSMAKGYDKAKLSAASAHRLQAAVEYIWRAPLKNGKQDIEKAIEDLRIALEYWDD